MKISIIQFLLRRSFLFFFVLFSCRIGMAQHTEHFRPNADPEDIELRTLLFQMDPNEDPIERTVQVIDGYVIIEGDIMLGLEKDLFGPGRGAVITDFGNNRWPNGTIPYEIEAGYPDVNMINYAINHLINNTNICMVPHTNEANYVKFVLAQGCSSNVGMSGGEQTINLAQNCGIAATVHEIMHAAGFWHEQSRADRNTYVTINVANIEPANAFNFNQYNSGMDIGPYDYGSIMHYGPYAFSSNGMPTIEIKIPPGTASSNIGQRVGVSPGDVSAINMLYPNDAGCGTINVPANLTVRSLGTLSIIGSVVTVTNCIIENDGSAAIGASSANFFYGLQGDNNVNFFGATQAIPALNPGQTHTIGITNDFAALANGTYYFGIWVNSAGNPVEGNTGDNFPSWNAPLLTLPVGAPQGYTCATAFDINAAGTFNAPGPNQGNGAIATDVGATHANWYRFTPPMTGMIRIFTCGLANGGNNHNHVYLDATNCPTNTNNVIHTADRGCAAAPNDPAAGVLLEDVPVTMNVPIYIEWDDALGNSNPFTWTLEYQGGGNGGCNDYVSADVPKTIQDNTPSGVNSTINVPAGGTITDINVKSLMGTHDYLGALIFTLKSPAGTMVTLINQSCDDNNATVNFSLSLDDQAAAGALPCPYNTGATYQPANPLSVFNGENPMGTWTLNVSDNDGFGDTGQLQGWTLEICTGGGGDCPPTRMVDNNPIVSGTYQAGMQLTSMGTVGAAANVLFRAGNNVELKNNFSTPVNATLEVRIEGCQ